MFAAGFHRAGACRPWSVLEPGPRAAFFGEAVMAETTMVVVMVFVGAALLYFGAKL